MAHRIQLEIERKFDVGSDITIPDTVGIGAIAVAEPPVVTELVAVYYDTADLALGAARTALRRREGGADAGWHLKVAEPGAEGRTEHHWPLTDGEAVPAEVVDAVRDTVADAPLRPVARVANRRETVLLSDAAGYPVAEFCDDHVEALDLRTGVERRWREWEVELQAAAPDDAAGRAALLAALTRAVEAVGGRPSASESKLARALGVDPMP